MRKKDVVNFVFKGDLVHGFKLLDGYITSQVVVVNHLLDTRFTTQSRSARPLLIKLSFSWSRSMF